VSDRANEFNGDTATNWQRIHGTRMLPTSSMRPRDNGKIKKINGDLKKIVVRKNRDHPATSLPELLQRAVKIHNRIPRPNGYSPYFLLYGTQPPDQHLQFEAYVREPTDEEDDKFQRKLAKHHEAPIARNNATGVKALRDQIRAYLQEGKALLRVYAPGDWVLRVR
jgi:hypothetical protein